MRKRRLPTDSRSQVPSGLRRELEDLGEGADLARRPVRSSRVCGVTASVPLRSATTPNDAGPAAGW